VGDTGFSYRPIAFERFKELPPILKPTTSSMILPMFNVGRYPRLPLSPSQGKKI